MAHCNPISTQKMTSFPPTNFEQMLTTEFQIFPFCDISVIALFSNIDPAMSTAYHENVSCKVEHVHMDDDDE